MIDPNTKRKLPVIFGESLLLSSIQVALASVEMSSRFSVLNFSKDQETLQNAANALSSYVVIGVVFTIGSILTLYGSFGWLGFFISLFINIIVMAWIILSYCGAFKRAAEKHNLQMPRLFYRLW